MNLYENIKKAKVAVLAIWAVFAMCSASWATNPYWVDNNGTASWGSCQSASPLSGASACSLSTANSNADDGDTINMRAGTYGTAIAPAHSGSDDSNRITFTNYNDEVVTISGLSLAMDLDDRSWITITGTAKQNIIITNCNAFLGMDNGSYNIFAYLTIDDGSTSGSPWGGFDIGKNSSYNWVHHCTISHYGYSAGGTDDQCELVQIGKAVAGSSRSNLLENNTFYHGGHAVMLVQSKYNVIRNNYFHNEEWLDSGTYGNRNLLILDRENGTMGWTLFEGNRVGFTGIPADTTYAPGIQIASHDSIIRKNILYASKGPAIELYTSSNCTNGANCSDNNHFYNNTIFYNGIGGVGSSRKRAIHLAQWTSGYTIEDTVIKNNLFEDNVGVDFYEDGVVNGTILSNNYWSADGDPKLTDKTVPGDETDDSIPNLTLQSSSPCIDAGTHLTQTNGSNSGSTTLIVDDARYFFSGDGSPWNIPSYTGIKGDYVYVSGWANPIEIASINYSTNTITLASSTTWSDNANVYLAISTSVGFNGQAPDVGAYEYGGSSVLPPPKNLIIKNPS